MPSHGGEWLVVPFFLFFLRAKHNRYFKKMFEQTLTSLSHQVADQFVLNQVSLSSPTSITPVHNTNHSSKLFGKYGCLVLLKTSGEEGASFPLQFDDKNIISFGRYPQNDIVINLDYVSRVHARIVLDDNSLWLTPISKTNSTYLNHEQINESVSLEDGDIIEIAGKQFKYINANSNGASQQTGSFPMPEKLSFDEDYSLTIKDSDSIEPSNMLLSPLKQQMNAFTSYKPTPQRASTVKSRFHTSTPNQEETKNEEDSQQHQILKRKSNGRKSVSFASNLVNQLVYTISETTNEIVKLKQLETVPLKRPREENVQDEELQAKKMKLEVESFDDEFSLGLGSKENSPSIAGTITVAPTVLEAVEVPSVSHFLPIATPNRLVQSSFLKHELKPVQVDVFDILDTAITPIEVKNPSVNFDQLMSDSNSITEESSTVEVTLDKKPQETVEIDEQDEQMKALIERIEQMKVVELRKELSKHGISTAGRKQELIDKLKNHLCNNNNNNNCSEVVVSRKRKGRK